MWTKADALICIGKGFKMVQMGLWYWRSLVTKEWYMARWLPHLSYYTLYI